MSVKKKIERVLMLVKKKNVVPIPEIVEDACLLKDKVALVLGATGGIGKAIVTELANSGCKVVACGSSDKSIEKAKQGLPESTKIKYFIFDLENRNGFSKRIEEATEIYGKIDILVFSAGVHSEKFDYFDMTEKEYERIMQINLESPFFLCQCFAKYLVKRKRGGGTYLPCFKFKRLRTRLHTLWHFQVGNEWNDTRNCSRAYQIWNYC